MAMPDNKRRGISFLISWNGIFCFVVNRKAAISSAARIARYRASSPEGRAMFLTNRPSVPNTVIEIISMILGFIERFIIITPWNIVD